MSYGANCIGGGLAQVAIDAFKGLPDVEVFGVVYTGMRLFLFATWFAVFAALLIAAVGLRDLTVVESGVAVYQRSTALLPLEDSQVMCSEAAPAEEARESSTNESHIMSANRDHSAGNVCTSIRSVFARLRDHRRSELSRLRVVPTVLRSSGGMLWLRSIAASRGLHVAVWRALVLVLRDVWELLRMRDLWRVIVLVSQTMIEGCGTAMLLLLRLCRCRVHAS